MLNLIGSHDVVRALTILQGAPDPETMTMDEQAAYHPAEEQRILGKRRMKLAVLLQMTFPMVYPASITAMKRVWRATRTLEPVHLSLGPGGSGTSGVASETDSPGDIVIPACAQVTGRRFTPGRRLYLSTGDHRRKGCLRTKQRRWTSLVLLNRNTDMPHHLVTWEGEGTFVDLLEGQPFLTGKAPGDIAAFGGQAFGGLACKS